MKEIKTPVFKKTPQTNLRARRHWKNKANNNLRNNLSRERVLKFRNQTFTLKSHQLRKNL